MAETQVEPVVDSIYKGGGRSEEQTRNANDLIKVEWTIIDKLVKMAEDSRSEKAKAFYYQTLAGHIRTLSLMLKLHGKPEAQDLAKLLSEINAQAKKIAKRLRQR